MKKLHGEEHGGAADGSSLFDWVPRIDLSGRIILAFGGLGSLAETFLCAASRCGARIVAADLPPQGPRAAFEEKAHRLSRNIARLGACGPPDVLEADVTSLEDVKTVFDRVRKEHGGVDVVVDFAGVSHVPFDFHRDEPADMLERFRTVTEINLTGAFLVTMMAARTMIPKRRGHIIHLCSSGSRLSLYGSYAYNASKHGVEGLVRTAAAQLAPFGVRINGIAPGTVITDLNRRLQYNPDGSLKPRGLSVLAHTPSKRFATREGVAETLLAMCVEQRHLTGNVIFPDDGYVVEGHSWPEGNRSLYAGKEKLDALFEGLDEEYPRT